MKRFGKTFWVIAGLGAFFFLLILLLSSVLDLGERIRSVGVPFEIAFYVLSGLLFYILILRPILAVVFSPTFSIDSLFDETANAKKNYLMYKRVAKNIADQGYLSENQKEAIENSLADPMLLKQTLTNIFDETIKKEVNKVIVSHAEMVFLSTAISQNGRLDLAAVLVINLRLIKELVLRCGFRPSYAALGRLSVNVMSTAIIAETLEGIDFNELFPSQGVNLLSEVPLLKIVTGSLAQGVGNALLSLRVGIICRNYLFMNLKGQTKKDVRRMAFGEAVILLPAVIAESLRKLPSRIKSMFEKAA